jgi:hypothetical protein
MSRLRNLAFAQRVVIVIGLAVTLTLLGGYVATDGFFRRGPRGGWFGQTFQTTTPYDVVWRPSFLRAFVVPTALTLWWTAASAWLLGGGQARATSSSRSSDQ